MNKVILLGNLGKDPEVRTIESGALVAMFSLATSENYQKDGEWKTTTEWHNIVCWRSLAEKAEKSLHKGDQVIVEGKLQYGIYTDSEGIKRSTTRIVVDHFRRLKGGSSKAEEWPSEEDAPPTRNSQATTSDPVPANANPVLAGGGGDGGKDDDLPF